MYSTNYSFESQFTLETDNLDYAPDETVTISLKGIELGAHFEFQVLHVDGPGADGIYGTLDDQLDAGPDGVSGIADDGDAPTRGATAQITIRFTSSTVSGWKGWTALPGPTTI